MLKLSPRTLAIVQALFVTFLWSTSWVLIKIGLKDVPALTFAGLRYVLAFLFLLPLFARHLRALRCQLPSPKGWLELTALGLIFYAVTQGTQFISLALLPAVTVSLLLNFTTLVVALLGILLLAERPTIRNWFGVVLSLGGAVLYFFPIAISYSQGIGLIVALASVIANSLSAILGRYINRAEAQSPVVVTTVSMGFGAAVLLVSGLLLQGLPSLTVANWTIIVWLALANTALAFTLWNRTLRTLSAVESSVINNTMLVQIAILAWIFLGEQISLRQIFGLALALGGALLVQLRVR